ncbi:hypothetical protein KR054_003300 [Drosophila jambulina]|nr:hypothetical protein KR054_003300 [Drosophila jambulina]
MILKRTVLLLLLSTAVRSKQESLRLNVPLWDVGDLYSRISNAFGAASSTPAPQVVNSAGATPWGDYYNALLQEYYNKKQGLYAANSASEVIPVEPVPLPIPVPVPLPRPPRPLRPLRPQRPTRPWPRPTQRPTRRSTTTRRPTTTTIRTTTTSSPMSSSSTSTSTPSISTTTEAPNSTTIEPTTNSTESSTTGGSSTTGVISIAGGSSTTGSFPSSTIVSSSKYLPISRSPTVLSLEGSSPGELRPERKLTVQSPPQSMTSLCHNYPRLCAKPEEAQYVRLTDGFGKPMLLILPGAVEEHPLPIVRPISSMQRPFRSRPYRRKNPSRSRYVYRLIKNRNKQRL